MPLIQVNISTTAKAHLEAEAKASGTSLSELVRQMIAKHTSTEYTLVPTEAYAALKRSEGLLTELVVKLLGESIERTQKEVADFLAKKTSFV